MKKIIFIILTIVVALVVYVNVNAEEIVIPDYAIRFRVIANSNSIIDQNMKIKVKNYVDNYLASKMIGVSDVDEARLIIKSEITNINKDIEEMFVVNNYNKDFSVVYGDNFFPDKLYKGVKYFRGSYESLVITIGDGNGENWWCVLFPPLCLLESEENNLDNVNYKFFVKDLISNIFE